LGATNPRSSRERTHFSPDLDILGAGAPLAESALARAGDVYATLRILPTIV
jgi:hypothetical protein